MPTAFVPSTIHDRAVVTVTGGVIPVGSTVTFRWFTGALPCTGPYTEETVAVPAGGTTATVESSARDLVNPNYTVSYLAIFTSGDPSLVASSMSFCEPMTLLAECDVTQRTRSGVCIDELTDDDIIRGKWQAGDRLIINRVIFSIDWDSTTQQFTKHVVYTFNDSVKKYGLRPAMRIESKGIRSTPTACGSAGTVGCGIAILDERAANLGARFADPPPLLNLEIFYRKHTWEPSDIICVTSAFVPNIVTGLRGIDHEAFEIINIQQAFAPEGKIILTLLDVEAITVPDEAARVVLEDETSMLIRQGEARRRLVEVRGPSVLDSLIRGIRPEEQPERFSVPASPPKPWIRWTPQPQAGWVQAVDVI